MIKTILIIIISVSIFGLVSFVIVRNSVKRRIETLVENEKKEFTDKLVAKLDKEQKEKEELNNKLVAEFGLEQKKKDKKYFLKIIWIK